MARLPALTRDDLPPDLRHVFDDLLQSRGFVPNLYAVMAHAPAAMATFIEFTSTLRAGGAFSAADKELAILLVGNLTGARTITAAHRGFAAAAGVSPEAIASIPTWRDAPVFDPRHRAILAFVEAVTTDIRVDDATWEAVRAHLTDDQLAELTLVAACYNMVARFLEPLEVDLDDRYAT